VFDALAQGWIAKKGISWYNEPESGGGKMTFLIVIGVLSIIVLLHEFGHFLVAKKTGVLVEEFGIGYPPRLFQIAEKDGTRYTVNLIPFGGFVRVAGEDDPSVEGGFAGQSKRVRAATLLAGPLMNLLLALVFFSLAFMMGFPAPAYQVKVYSVSPGSPAEKAGILPGDIIVSADGHIFRTPEEVSEYTRAHLGQEVTLKLKRGEEELEVHVTPRPEPPPGEGPMGVVITMAMMKKRASPSEAVLLGLKMSVGVIVFLLRVPALVIKGLVPLEALRPVGPIGAGRIVGEAVQQSVEANWWFPFFYLVGFLNVAVAITNLLPIPALDGGRLFFILVEAIRGKRVDPEKEGFIHLVGLAFLVALMVIITFQDVTSPLPSIDWGALF